MLKKLIAGIAAGVMCVGVATAQTEKDKPDSLMIGDEAPALNNVNWLQGGPVGEWQDGHVYVLDFWATWCGPCVAAIPHMNDTYKEYSDDNVHVVGVAIWPSPNMTPTDEFVAEKGSGMAYAIAEDVDGKTADAFMKAAGQRGIPTIMIINQEGRLAWMGHPMEMDEPLEQIVAGDWDVEKALKEMQRKAELEEKAMRISMLLRKAMQDENWDNAVKAIDELVALDADMFGGYMIEKYRILATEMNASDQAAKIGRDLVSNKYWDNSSMLNAFAWGIVEPDGAYTDDEMDLDLALKAAERASKLTDDEDASILDTLARVHFRRGDVAKAVKIQKMAVSHAEGPMRDDLQTVLDEYEEALSTF